MPDAEDFTLQLAETGTERHVEALQNHLAHEIGIMSGRQHDGGERVAAFRRVHTKNLETPCLYRLPCRLTMACMPRKHIRQAFFLQHEKRLAQAVQQIR